VPQLRARKAFTLVELLVVIAIIVVLAAMMLPAFSRAMTRAREVVVMNELRQLMIGIGMFARSHGELPASAANAAEEDVDALVGALGSSAQGIRLDPWGNEYIYIRSDKYAEPGAVVIADRDGVPLHPHSFQLYSKGADEKRSTDASDEVNSDNIWVDLHGVRVVRFSDIQKAQ